ncbi:MAG: methyl-accepting chemotaxis protein [Nitrospirae bacterium]|nr:methyl-accepting chemotaxis protein [Nitrospirota bacterium]
MIEKSFERKFILRFTGIVLTGMGVIALLLYIAIPSLEIRHYADAIQSFIEADDALSGVIRAALIVESIVISGVVVLVAVLASHKIAGPVYSLRRVLNELVNTRKVRPITFRSYDQLQDTAGSFNTMINGLNEHFRAISDAYEEFEGARKEIDDTPESAERLKEKVDNLGKAIERFRV